MHNQALKHRVLEEFWLDRFEKLSRNTRSELPYSEESGEEMEIISKELHDKILHLANGSPLLVYTFYSTAFAYLLSQYNTDQSVVWLSGRFIFDGSLSNDDLYLPHSLAIHASDTFKAVFSSNKKNLIEAYKSQSESVLTGLKPKHNHLLPGQICFSYEGITGMPDDRSLCQFEIHPGADGTMNIIRKGASPALRLSPYFLQSYVLLLEAIAASPNAIMSSYELVGNAERDKILHEFNQTTRDYAKSLTIVSRFEEQVRTNPEKTALIFEGQEMSYRELNIRSNRFAHFLREKYQIQVEDFVGIQLDRNMDMIVANLGALKSGATYVPVDIEYPTERVAYIKADSSCKVMVDSLVFETFEASADSYSENTPDVSITAESVAYMIYTSGTTGKPKGTLVRHSSLMNYNQWFLQVWNEEAELNGVLSSSPAFDGVFTVIYGCMLNGGSLHLMKSVNSKDPDLFIQYLIDNKITFLKGTPAFYTLIFNHEKS